MDTTAPLPRQRARVLLALALAGSTTLAGLSGPASAARPDLVTVVVSGAGGVAEAVRAAGGTVLDALPLVGGVIAHLPRGARLGPAFRVVPDRPMSVAGTTAPSGPASTVRATLGLGAPAGEGSGQTIAVVDTGVADVPDLAGRLTHVDVTQDGTGDGYGHGTFVAGLVAGDGSSSGGAYAGVAPGASVLDVRVAHDDGSSSLVLVLKGLQAVAAHPEVDVLNLSLSSGSPLPWQLDPLTQALDALWRRGVTVVVPAGNDGDRGAGSISSPGVDPTLITVGGLDEHGTAARGDDTIAPWSSQGPAPQGVDKPDLAAPGAHLVSLRAPGSVVDVAHPTSEVGTDYFVGSGTSFSTAVTSGSVAALLARRPQLRPDRVKALLTGTAYDAPALATGGLDLRAALTANARGDDGRGGDQGNDRGERAPGSRKAWQAFVDALIAGDHAAAASSWADLGPAARNWAASSWAALTPEARNWAASSWAAGTGWTDDGIDWAARNWAARNWAARNWADSDWSARNWSARNWAARNWSDGTWTARNWSARNWSSDDWSARNWSARNWSASTWSAYWG